MPDQNSTIPNPLPRPGILRRRAPRPGDTYAPPPRTPAAPGDRMGWNADANGVHDRYAKAPDEMADYAAQANRQIADQASLIGGDPLAVQEQQSRLGGLVKPTTTAVDADHARWDAWWNVVPGSDYDRLLALGRAAQQMYDLKHRKGKKKGGKKPATVFGPPDFTHIGSPTTATPPGYSGVPGGVTYVPGVG